MSVSRLLHACLSGQAHGAGGFKRSKYRHSLLSMHLIFPMESIRQLICAFHCIRPLHHDSPRVTSRTQSRGCHCTLLELK